MRKMNTKQWWWASLASVLVLGFVIRSAVSQQRGSGATVTPEVAHAESLSAAFHQAADAVLPTVVKIKSQAKERTVMRRRGQREENPFRGTPFEDFFNFEGEESPFAQRIPRREGTGSGVIIGADGLILTNNHVVAGADTVRVELADGREFIAKDIRTDPKSDLAVLRIEGAGKITAARLGDSDVIEIGDWVLAIGNPFELEASVSAGIISAKGRSLGSAERTQFLQTDAAINPGNSGGPLVNLHGEVIGINTAIASSSGGYQGIGFAIPVNHVKWVVDQLVNAGSVSRAYLGIGIKQLTPREAEQLGVESRQSGVAVIMVGEGSPAEKAGIQAGDVITHFAGQPVGSPAELQRVVERSPLGSRQKVSILRRGRAMEFEVTTESLPGDDEAKVADAEGQSPRAGGLVAEQLGMEVVNLDHELAQQLDLPPSAKGVIVASVDASGLARESGVQRGMLIVGLDDTSVTNVKEFEEALKGASLERGLRLTIKVPGEGTRLLFLQQQ